MSRAADRCDVRLDADWMTRADDRVLEFLAEAGPATPSEVAADDRVGFSSQHVGNRCREYLVPYGLAERDDGEYDIARPGERYLAGDLDAGDLAPDEL
jgi:hypothetical protein